MREKGFIDVAKQPGNERIRAEWGTRRRNGNSVVRLRSVGFKALLELLSIVAGVYIGKYAPENALCAVLSKVHVYSEN